MDGGKIIDLLKYQEEKQIEKKEELVKERRRGQTGRRAPRETAGDGAGM